MPHNFVIEKGLAALDADWQFPAITEKHAFKQMHSRLPLDENAPIYVGFPWATLIDKLSSNTSDAEQHLARFREFISCLPPKKKRITVCQHISLMDHIDLFVEAGISEVFWSHATTGKSPSAKIRDIRLHPFPLFPVQVFEQRPEAGPADDPTSTLEKKFLFSFVGARPNKWYLSEVRAWIIDYLSQHPRANVVGRNEWHYQRIVYDHQVRKKSAVVGELVEVEASDNFRNSLKDSLFTLCPSGTGPNTIRLWEAIGAGSIPVVFSDTWWPPGERKLWDAAVVFCEETLEDVVHLPERLEAIASEPDRIVAMRHALRQLWLLYGPQNFIYDVEKRFSLLIETADCAPDEAATVAAVCHLLDLSGKMLVKQVSKPFLPRFHDVAEAMENLPAEHPAVLHFNHVWKIVAANENSANIFPSLKRRLKERLETPTLLRDRPPLIHLFGRHGHRTPFSYAPLRRAIKNRVNFTDDPMKADILMTGFSIDLRENANLVSDAIRGKRNPKVVVLSEEPLWDTLWSGGFAERKRIADCDGVIVPYTVLNHFTSEIFDFRTIPYFLLTTDDFAPRYAALIGRQATRSPRDLLEHWSNVPLCAAIFAEKRDKQAYAPDLKHSNARALSLFRSQIAKELADSLPRDRVLLKGKGWDNKAPRQQLADWHLDKIAALFNRVKIVGAYETTCQKRYVTEKIFDAFAVGGIPSFFASEDHRVFDLVPEAAMLNDAGLLPHDAAKRMLEFSPDISMAEAWCETARSLTSLFRQHNLVAEERKRVIDFSIIEVHKILDE